MTRRSLVLAGGGLKVAYQAGVLQVWLDEAGLRFDHADGSSGGVFNLAMWCQGRTGTQIADAWRGLLPLRWVTPNLHALGTGALLTGRGLRERMLPALGLDWEQIRGTTRQATFNLFNVSKQEHVVLPAAEMTPALLVSAVSLPIWFPAVRSGGDLWSDAVFATDANLDEALRLGADEVWVVWTVSTRGNLRPGLVPAYFAMVEASANSRLRTALDRIARNAAERAQGRPGELGRDVTLHLLAAEVPLHYLLVFTRAALKRAVEQGVRDSRAWCAERGIPTSPATPETFDDTVTFSEVMSGPVQPVAGGAATPLRLSLDVAVHDVRRFVVEPGHVAEAGGTLTCPPFGTLPIESGTFNVLVDDAGEKQMRYELAARTPDGRLLAVSGVKHVPPGRVRSGWASTTTLFTSVRLDGRDWAAGVLRISVAGFLHQLTTFRAQAPTPVARAAALAGYGTFFLGSLWQVYGPPAAPPGLPAAWLTSAERP